jgi:hypothetical protein
MLMLGRSDEYVYKTLSLAHRQALQAGDVVNRLYSDQNDVVQAEEFLANLIDRSPESNLAQAIVGRLKAWIAQRFPQAIKYLNWTTQDFRQLAIVSLRKFGSDSLNMPIKYRKGYEADGVSLILSRPIKKRPRLPAVLSRVVKTVDLRDVKGFQKAVQDASEELLSSETLDRLIELNPQLDPFAYRDAIQQVAENGDADAAFDLSQMLEPLRGQQVPVNVRFARATGFGETVEGSPEYEAAVAKGLDMSRPARMQRAKEMGFDTDTVLYHGTARGGFSEFDPYGTSAHGLFGQGVYLTDNPEVASSYTTKGKARMERRGETAREAVYPVVIKLQNPIDMEAKADIEAWRRGLDEYGYSPEEFEDAGDIDLSGDVSNEEMFRALENVITDEQIPMYEGAERVQDILRAMGHDGATHVGGGRVSADGVRHNVSIVFDPENIRSVNAAFDPAMADRPNILYARRPRPQTGERDFFDPYSYPRPYMNLNRIQGYDDFKAYIRELADDAAPEVAQKVGPTRTLEQVEREAASENAFAALARRRKGNILTDREMLALRWLRDASAQKVREVAAVAASTDSKAAKAALLRVIHLHRAIQAEVSGASADASRLLGSLRILSEAKSVRAMELSDAIANWDNDENVNDLIKKINRLSETQQTELDQLIEVGFKQAWTDLGGAWIRALFLSNPKTHIVNGLGNQMTMALNIGETFIGGMLTADQTLMSEAGQRFGAMVDAYWHQLKYMKEHSQFNPLKKGFSLKFDDLGVSGHQVDAGGNQRALSASRVSALTGGLASADESSPIGRTIEILGYGLAAPSEALAWPTTSSRV